MRNKFLIFLAFVGILGFSACEKDEIRAVLDENPTVPTLVPTSGAISLSRDNSTDTLIFDATEADFGYKAAIKYIFEMAISGTDFESPIQVASQSLNSTFKITEGELNTILIQTLPEDVTNDLEWRVKAEIESSDNGDGPIMAISVADPILIKTYGPPSLYITGDANSQRLVSANDDGVYTGWIYTDGSDFTLTNRDDGKVYGVTGGVVTEDGDAISLEAGGWNVEINLNDQTMASEDVTIGIIGDAVGGWDNDTKMIWDFTDNTWNLSGVTVVSGGIKFRTHNSWAAVNVAYHPDNHDLANLYQSNSEEGKGDSQNIDDVAPGTYDVKLSIDSTPMWVTFTAAK